MKRSARIALAVLSVAYVASVATTGGIAWYLRSDGYRRYCSAQLAASIALPSDIGGITPRSSRSRQFDDVRVWLPDRRDQVFHCRTALYELRPTPQDPQAYVLTLTDGECEISTRTWLREDYRHVVEAGLHPGFTPGGPDEVTFSGMDMRFARDAFEMRLEDAAGTVRFENDRFGNAHIFCRRFNGNESREPVTLTAAFSARGSGMRVDRLELVVPRIPLRVVGVGDLFGAKVQSGAFSGRLSYNEADSGRLLVMAGTLTDLSLAEFTAPFLPAGASGTCAELELVELRVEDRVPTHLRFRGVIRGASLGELLAPLGFAALGGETTLRIRDAELTPDGILNLALSAECRGASLDGLTTALKLGRASGRVNLSISDLRIENNKLVALDADVRVDESAAEPLWVDGELLATVAQRALGQTIPSVLTPGEQTRLAYKRLGAKLDVRDEQLRVFGTHGAKNNAILSIELLGREVAVIHEPRNAFDLRPLLDDLRRQAGAQARERWPERWRAPASQSVSE